MSFVCFYCSKIFKQKVSLKEHIIKRICFIVKEHRCWCGKECISPAALKVHKSKFHSSRVKYETVSLSFPNFSEFSAWKEAMEEETLSKFVKVRGVSTLKNGSKKIKFACHRSGKIRLKTGERQRATRKKGSCKLNATCPAFIRIEEDMNGVVKAEYHGTHYNHKNDVEYLTLTRKEREKIADELNRGATFEEILDEIRNSSVNDCDQPKRIHMVTKADLTNIVKEFKISFKERLAKDLTSIQSLVQECEKNFEENSPIKLFKPLNIDGVEGMEGANSEDFVLVIMTSVQKQMLTQYEYSQLCIDSTHGMKGFDFHLTTLLTINDSGVSLPVAFCISNVVNEDLMGLFFTVISKECGCIRTSVFTSNEVPFYINAWCKIMGIPEKWQVDKDLQQNLQTMKIATEIGNELDVNIRALMREMDDKILSILLKKFVTKFLEHRNTKQFGQFFEREYSSPPSNLDADYRRHVEVHTNYKLEAMFRVLKSVHLKSLKMKRIDFSIFRLLKMCWDNLFSRLTYLNDECDLYALEVLKDRHTSALSIPRKNIIKHNNSFEVQSWSNPFVTHVVEMNPIECSCHSRCTECTTCLHVYSCNCIDYTVAGNFCKHVHAVCTFERNLSETKIEVGDDLDGQLEVVLSADDIPSPVVEDKKFFDCSETRDELIKTLLHTTHLLQTHSYDSKVYDQGGKLIRKALDVFNEARILESDADEPSRTPTGTLIEIVSPKVTKIEVSELPCEEPVAEEVPDVESESQILVDDVVEEVVYVDVHTTYDAFS